jgi:CTP:molybdopterin cytidylyltransferase MocA
LGSSLLGGLAALRDLGAAAAVVLLVDQPRVTAALVERVVATWRGATTSAVVPSYGGQPRNPVLLDASAWDAVAALAVGDVGARAWLRAHPEDVTIVACDDLGDAVDIDTDADLTQLLEDMR